jgi:hypothetical protein
MLWENELTDLAKNRMPDIGHSKESNGTFADISAQKSPEIWGIIGRKRDNDSEQSTEQ